MMKKFVARVRAKLGRTQPDFRGVYGSFQEAMGSVHTGLLAGYDHESVADVSYERMCQVIFWDWPVLYWLSKLIPVSKCLLDAGGHMGTKYRAFRGHLPLEGSFRWVVYDVPAIVRTGRERAKKDGLDKLEFIDNLKDAPAADVFLGSGLLQYLDIPFGDLLRQLPVMPRHLVLNKVATHDQPTAFTLENLSRAEVPYQIRNHNEFLEELNSLGYEIVDRWLIPYLSHTIRSRGRTVVSKSHGVYARLKD